MKQSLKKLLVGVALLATVLNMGQVARASMPSRSLRVGICSAPPFAYRAIDGNWDGFAVKLWQEVAFRNHFSVELIELDAETIQNRLAAHSLDAGIIAIPVTVAMERNLDFSHPFHVDGFGVLFRPENGVHTWHSVIRGLVENGFFHLACVFGALLLIVSYVMWHLEHRANRRDFGGTGANGIGEALWWAIVTVTTVGYGDKAPRTFAGRIIASLWMMGGLAFFSIFTAALVSSLVSHSSQYDPKTARDLRTLKIAVVGQSAASLYLEQQGVPAQEFADRDQALAALNHSKVQGYFGSRPGLEYIMRQDIGHHYLVTEKTFGRDYYAFSFPTASFLIEPVNQTILELLNDPVWQQLRETYLAVQ